MSAIDDASVTKGLLGGQLNTTLSFMGLMKFFFSFDEDVENAEAINDDENFIDDEISENDNEQPIKQDEREKKRSINSRFQKRFQKEMEGYFNKLRSEDFRNQCTVSQLKQAAAYPLIITVFGKRNFRDFQGLEHVKPRNLRVVASANARTYAFRDLTPGGARGPNTRQMRR